jgi:hypothetical protein
MFGRLSVANVDSLRLSVVFFSPSKQDKIKMVYHKLESIWTLVLLFSLSRNLKIYIMASESPVIRICVCGLFCESVSIRIMWLRMVGCLMNLKGFGRKLPWPNRGSFRRLPEGTDESHKNTFFMMSGILSEIRAEDRPKMSSELPLHQPGRYWEFMTIVSLDANSQCSLSMYLYHVRIDQLSTTPFQTFLNFYPTLLSTQNKICSWNSIVKNQLLLTSLFSGHSFFATLLIPGRFPFMTGVTGERMSGHPSHHIIKR